MVESADFYTAELTEAVLSELESAGYNVHDDSNPHSDDYKLLVLSWESYQTVEIGIDGEVSDTPELHHHRGKDVFHAVVRITEKHSPKKRPFRHEDVYEIEITGDSLERFEFNEVVESIELTVSKVIS